MKSVLCNTDRHHDRLGNYYGLNVGVPQNSCIEILPPRVMVAGGGPWEVIRLDEVMGVGPYDGIVPSRRVPTSPV